MAMPTITFSILHAEIHVNIAKHCAGRDLYNLCLSSKRMNERCFCALYGHVDLQLDPHDSITTPKDYRMWERQRQFFHTLLSHPEYGKHVRSLKTSVHIPDRDGGIISNEEFWQTMQSFTHVQSVDLVSKFLPWITMVPTTNLPANLFQSSTSVRLAGDMHYGLAESILNAINPATLKHLCLDLVDEYEVKQPKGAIYHRGAAPGLLKMLTGRCTALRTLILRRVGQYYLGIGKHQSHYEWHVFAEEASYSEWASFIRSVQGTLKEFTFDHVEEECNTKHLPFRFMDERFLQFILPAILSGNWPCLTMMELRGVRTLSGQDGEAALIMQLRAAIGGDSKIVAGE